jgi:quercetin dioxygenase-like cupin family protein
MSGAEEFRLRDNVLVTVLRSGRDNGGRLLEVESTFPPGVAGPPAHVHSKETEEFTVLDGRLWVRIGRRRLHLEQGESASIPPGTVYAFANRSDAPVSFRAVSTLPPQPLRGTGGTPAGILEQMVRLQAEAGSRRTPLLRIARLNQGEDQTFFLPGLPRPAQRLLWNALAALAREPRRHT